MQDVQAFLDYLSLLPIATAAALFLFHLLICWQRCAKPHHLPGIEKTANPETVIPVSVEPEPCHQVDLEPQKPAAAKAMSEAQTVVILPEVLASGVYHQSVESSEADSAIATLEKSPPFPAFSLRTESTDPNKMTSEQLRKECSKLGIKWRNANGKGKHLSRKQMLQAIGEAIA